MEFEVLLFSLARNFIDNPCEENKVKLLSELDNSDSIITLMNVYSMLMNSNKENFSAILDYLDNRLNNKSLNLVYEKNN